MAQADLNVANQSGSAFRADLNNQLLALGTLMSGASEPSTTYAYMLWADTANGQLKQRNAANSGWVVLGSLATANLGLAALASPTFTGTVTIPTLSVTGTAGVPLGSAGAPTYSFTGDPNTGVFSPGADQVAISTGGSGRVFINSNGLGVGGNPATSDTGYAVDAYGPVFARGAILSHQTNAGVFAFTGNETMIRSYGATAGTGFITFSTGGGGGSGDNERLRITSAGLVGIGVSSVNANLHVKESTANTYGTIRVEGSNRGGEINFHNGTAIQSAIWGNSNTLNFATGASYTQAMIIDSSQRVGIGYTSPGESLSVNGNVSIGATSSSGYRLFVSGSAYVAGSTNYIDGTTIFRTGGSSEIARLDSSGRLLVGTSSTSGLARTVIQGYVGDNNGLGLLQLQVGSTSPGFALGRIDFTDSNSNAGARFLAERDGGTWTSGSSHPTRLTFSTTADGASSPTEALRIDRNQDVCIGSANSRASRVCIETDGGAKFLLTLNDLRAGSAGGNTCLRFMRESTQVGGISTTSSATSYNTSSDYRLKENIAPVTDGIARLQQLKPSRFNFIADPDTVVDGFIAHEVQPIVPEAITGQKDAVDDDDNPVYQGIDQSKLVPLLTAALQEAVSRIEQLEARLTDAGL